ncbi:MAG: hypothetical protein ACK5UD_10895 [Planctomyces sp.]
MLLDRTHTRWALLSGLTLTIGAAAWFICNAASPNGLSGGSVPGLIFGIIGTLMMFFAGMLGARRPLRHRRIGSASFWLKGHLWLGTLCIPFILFHASFSLGGLLEQVLWFCLAFVAASGFFGLAVQQFLPRLLWKNVPLESFEPQSPWLCDRMTLTADIRLSTACDRSLPEINDHLRQSARRLVQGFDEITAGSENRSEKNARKLLMMQQLTPMDHRDFFWSMAKVAKGDLKAISFEGDFADLLAKIYENLRELQPANTTNTAATTAISGTTPEPAPVAPSHTRTTAAAQTSALDLMKQKAAEKAGAAAAAANSPAPTPADPAQAPPQPAATPTPQPKLSPLELMKQKAAEKAAAAAAAAANSPAPTPAEPAQAPPQSAATTAPQPKLSPLELMKQKAAEKAAAAAAANNPAPTPAQPAATPTPQPKLSPLELMKQKAAEKAAAAAANNPAPTPAEPAQAPPQPAATTTPQPKLSPLELMKQKAAEKAAAETAQAPAEIPPASPAVTTAKPAVVRDPKQPPAKTPLPPRNPPAAAPPAAPVPPAARPASTAPSPEDRQILWQFYTLLVRPFISNSRSVAAVRQSPLANDIDAGRRFRDIQSSLPASLHELLGELQEYCDTRRQIEQQRTILRWMHWWLALHIPVSLLLIVFTLAHIVMALRVVPFRF